MTSTNKNIVHEWLKDNPSFECVLPSGGTVCFLKYYFDLDTLNKLGYKAKINTHTTSYIN